MERKIDGDARIFVILVCFSTRCIFLLVARSHVSVHAFWPYRSPCTEREIVPVFVFWAWRDSFFPRLVRGFVGIELVGTNLEIAPKRAGGVSVFPANISCRQSLGHRQFLGDGIFGFQQNAFFLPRIFEKLAANQKKWNRQNVREEQVSKWDWCKPKTWRSATKPLPKESQRWKKVDCRETFHAPYGNKVPMFCFERRKQTKKVIFATWKKCKWRLKKTERVKWKKNIGPSMQP